MYKIKFLEALLPNKEQTEFNPVYNTQYFSDADVHKIAKNWRVFNKKVVGVEIAESKHHSAGILSVNEVIDLFYPDKMVNSDGSITAISEHDKKAKEDLLPKLEVKPVKGEADTSKDEEKEHRAEMRAKLIEAGQAPKKNATTKELEEFVSKL
jgi:hypothetical protein